VLSGPEGLYAWMASVDIFLGRLGLPGHAAYPDYVPSPFPPATHAAEVGDVDAVPYIDDVGRAKYRKFLELPFPRVFYVSPDGWAGFWSGGFDGLAAGRRACARDGRKCVVYAVDGAVTWAGPPLSHGGEAAAPLPSPDDVPYLSERGRQAYRQFLKLHKPRAFALAPDGGYGMATGNGDPAPAALANCGREHKDCRLYVVDDRVTK
jgi:hypothetical protein